MGWSMSNNMKAELVNNALLMAIFSRKPAKGLIWHSDRGSQYVAESFFATLKNELVYQQKFNTREEAKHAIFEYIEVFYNRIRVHSANDYLSPTDYETDQKCA